MKNNFKMYKLLFSDRDHGAVADKAARSFSFEAASAVSYIVGVDAQKLTFHRCRAPDPLGQLFTIDECSALGQVMNINSAVIGYSDGARLYDNPPSCNLRTCTLSFYGVVLRLCHGRRNCSIDQNLLIRPGPGRSALCALQTDANFIYVIFYCVSGTIYFLCLPLSLS